MANVLTYIELRDKQAKEASLCALNAGRAVASKLGATLYAVLPCKAPPSYDDDDIIAVLARHGADKVILVTGPDLDDLALHATHGEAVRAACVQFRARLVFLASTTAGRDIGPRLAMQLGARFLSDVELQPGDDDLALTGLTFRRRFRVSQPLRGAAGPLVATLQTRAAPRTLGADEAEVVMLQSPARDPAAPKPEGRRRAPDRDPLSARLVIAGGAGLENGERFVQLQRLASALGAAPVASPTALARRMADAELATPGCIGAELYLAFGVSGSERHLASLAPWTRIVAVNSDPAAPILGVADRALIGDADQVMKDLLAEVDRAPES